MIGVANLLLHAIHLLIINFALFGWIIPQFRVWHVALCIGIAISWFVIGPISGKPGMCIVTEVQACIWRRMKAKHAETGYVPYLLQKVTGKKFADKSVDIFTQVTFYGVAVLSVMMLFIGK